MDISSTTSGVTSSTTSSVPNPSQPANNNAAEKDKALQQPSTVVNISDQAKKLDEAKNAERTAAERAATEKTAAENRAAQSKATSESPGIQFVSGESKGGRVNTFA